MNALINLTPQQLRTAADLQERIQSLQAQLAQMVGGSAPAQKPVAGKKGQISAAGRARIAAAARARWARERAAKQGGTAPKRRLSPAARRRISEIAKARWAKAKASGKKSL